MISRWVRLGCAAAVLVGTLVVTADAATAVPAGTVGTFPTWSTSGVAGAYSATASFTSPTLPDPSVATDSVTIASASGASAFLGPGTGFGQEFGSTRAQPYLTLRPTSASPAPTPPSTTSPPPSTTVIDFGTSTPASGWGFALGDIDADWVYLRAFDATGSALPVSALGEREVANYCDSTPKPAACSGVSAPYDVPNWTGTASVPVDYGGSTIVWAPGTVYGNTADTAGAYAWFVPDPTVRRVELSYGALSGSPVFQLWLSQPAPSTTLTGTVTLGDRPGSPIPTGTVVELESADGSPVAALDESPVGSPVAADGSWSLVTEQRDAYRLSVIAPPGYRAPDPVTVAPATLPTIVVAPFVLSPSTVAGASDLELAATGPDVAAFPLGIALVSAGTVLLVTSRRRRDRLG